MTEAEANDLLVRTLSNQVLEDIQVYNHDQPYVLLEDRDVIIVSAGIALSLKSGQISLTWDQESQIFKLNYESFVPDDFIQDVGIRNLEGYNQLVDKRVTGVRAKWNYYQNLDENQELLDEKFYVPQEIILDFDNGQTMQIATINYGLDVQQNDIYDLIYDITNDLLISLNPYTEIKEEDEMTDLIP